MKKNIHLFFLFIGTLLALALLLSLVDVRGVYAVLRESNFLLILAATAVLYCAHPFMILRWSEAIRLTGHHLLFGEVARAYLANIPITKFTPSYSGDFIRPLYLREKIPLAIGSGVIFLETLIDIGVLALSIIIGAFWTQQFFFATFASLLIASFVLFGLLLSTSTAHKFLARYPLLKDFFSAILILKKNASRLPLLVILSILGWMGTILFFKIVFIALGHSIPLSNLLLLQPLAVVASLIPVTVSGVGIRESAMAVLYGGMISAPTIVAAGLLYSFFTVIIFPAMCLPLTLSALTKKRKKEQ